MRVYIGTEVDDEGRPTNYPEVRGVSMRGLKTAATRSDYVRLRVIDLRDVSPYFWMCKTKRGWERFDRREEMLAWSRMESG